MEIEKFEKHEANLSKCKEVAAKLQRGSVDLLDKSTSCVTDKVVTIAEKIKPLQKKLNDMKKVLHDYAQEASECVGNRFTSIPRNIACLTEVSCNNQPHFNNIIPFYPS